MQWSSLQGGSKSTRSAVFAFWDEMKAVFSSLGCKNPRSSFVIGFRVHLGTFVKGGIETVPCSGTNALG